MKDRLIIDEDRGVFRISWYLAEEGDIGASLGEDTRDGTGDPPADREHWEHWMASKMAREATPQRDHFGYYWTSRTGAAVVLRQIKEALKQERPLPEWAKTALAEGWKPPKGWKA